MAWCRQVTSHCLSQCWLSSPSPCGVTRAQWVKCATISIWYKLAMMKMTNLYVSMHIFRNFKDFNIIVSFHNDIFNLLDIFITNYSTIRCAYNAVLCLFLMWSYLSSRSAGASRRSRVGSYHIVVLLYLLIEVVSSQPVVAIFLLEQFRIDRREFLDVYSPESCVCQRASPWGILQAALIFLQC